MARFPDTIQLLYCYSRLSTLTPYDQAAHAAPPGVLPALGGAPRAAAAQPGLRLRPRGGRVPVRGRRALLLLAAAAPSGGLGEEGAGPLASQQGGYCADYGMEGLFVLYSCLHL